MINKFIAGVVAGRNRGHVSSAPDMSAPTVVVSASVSEIDKDNTFIATITFSRDVINFVIGDITETNCTLSDFTAVTAKIYTVLVDPTAVGALTIQVPAAVCTSTNAIDNEVSNTLSIDVVDDASSYNLEDAADISVSQHYRGHVASFAEVTDIGNEVICEMQLCRENLGGLIFFTSSSSPQAQKDKYKFGRIDFGTKIAGLSLFLTRDPFITAIRDGNPMTVISYTGGNDANKLSFMPYVLGGRNSNYAINPADALISYATGYTDVNLISRASSFRLEYWSSVTSFQNGTFAEGLANVATIIENTISTEGWYTHFAHWNNYTTDEELAVYFRYVKDQIGSSDAYRGTYSSIVEYYFVRESITSVTGTGSTVTVNFAKDYPSSPYDRITTPAWIKLDLTGTIYAGEDIAVNHGGKIRSLGNDIYYVSVPLDFDASSTTFEVSITATPSYINLAAPVVSRSGNNITADQPCKYALFRKTKAQEEMVSTLVERSLTLASNYTIVATLDEATYDYYLAYINGEGISGVYQFLPSDYILWEAATSVDDQPTSDGDFFWHNPGGTGIRASLHYDEGAYSIETVSGREYYKIYLDPDTPDAGPSNNNYRAEIARHTTTKVVGTVRMLGSGFMFPEILNHGGELIIAQWHTGTAPGGPYPFNFPVIYLGVAAAGQTDQYSDASVLNELVVVNKVVDFEGAGNGRTNTGIVITAGTEYFFKQYLKGGTGAAGRYILQIKVGRGGVWQTIYDEAESTIWNQDADGGSNSQVTPYWKWGMYAQNITTDAEVVSEKALNGGVYNITMYYLDKIKTADLLAADNYYSSNRVLDTMDTSI